MKNLTLLRFASRAAVCLGLSLAVSVVLSQRPIPVVCPPLHWVCSPITGYTSWNYICCTEDPAICYRWERRQKWCPEGNPASGVERRSNPIEGSFCGTDCGVP